MYQVFVRGSRKNAKWNPYSKKYTDEFDAIKAMIAIESKFVLDVHGGFLKYYVREVPAD